MLDFVIATQISTFLAAAGGGGSSSNGDGGDLFALIGYFPSFYLGKLIKKLLPRTAELIVSASFASIISVALVIIAIIAGGGIFLVILIIIGIWSGWYAAFFDTFDKLRGAFSKNKVAMNTAAQADSAWDENTIEQYVRSVFASFESDWSSFNRQRISSYTTPRYYTHVNLMLTCLEQLGRANVIESPVISQYGVIDVIDDQNNANDRFTAVLEWKAKDKAVVQATGQTLWENNHATVEYWNFVRNQNNWLLDGITQDSSAPWLVDNELLRFATANSMYYSLDMGVLFLPYSGILFSDQQNKRKKDVNNHVVGTYNGHLVQFYTFSFLYTGNKGEQHHQLIAQIQLPTSYGGILIESNKSKRGNRLFGLLKNSVPPGYTQYSFEWPDFNNRYRVYATDADRLAAFELVNPSFMAYLYDNDPEASIEVSSNVVYLYKPVESVVANDYQKFLTIMLKAFKELKL
jgi:hypothetical protein